MSNIYTVYYTAGNRKGSMPVAANFMTLAILRAQVLLAPYGADITGADVTLVEAK